MRKPHEGDGRGTYDRASVEGLLRSSFDVRAMEFNGDRIFSVALRRGFAALALQSTGASRTWFASASSIVLTSRFGDVPNMRLYSRLNWVALS